MWVCFLRLVITESEDASKLFNIFYTILILEYVQILLLVAIFLVSGASSDSCPIRTKANFMKKISLIASQ